MTENGSTFIKKIQPTGFSLDSTGPYQVSPQDGGLQYSKLTFFPNKGIMETSVYVFQDPEDRYKEYEEKEYMADYHAFEPGLAQTFVSILPTLLQNESAPTPVAYIGYQDSNGCRATFIALPLDPSIQDIFVIKNKELSIIRPTDFNLGKFTILNDDIIKIEEIDGEINIQILTAGLIKDLTEQEVYTLLDISYEPTAKLSNLGNEIIEDTLKGRTTKNLSLIPNTISATIREVTDEEEAEIDSIFMNPES